MRTRGKWASLSDVDPVAGKPQESAWNTEKLHLAATEPEKGKPQPPQAKQAPAKPAAAKSVAKKTPAKVANKTQDEDIYFWDPLGATEKSATPRFVTIPALGFVTYMISFSLH